MHRGRKDNVVWTTDFSMKAVLFQNAILRGIHIVGIHIEPTQLTENGVSVYQGLSSPRASLCAKCLFFFF